MKTDMRPLVLQTAIFHVNRLFWQNCAEEMERYTKNTI